VHATSCQSMSPELCLCSKKSWTVAFVSHRLGLQARDILRSIFASLGGLNIEETRTSSFPCTSCNRRVDSLPLIPSVWAQNTPGYNNKIPPQTTPDTFDDWPTKETSQKVYDISISCAALRCSSTSFRQPPSKQSSGHGGTGLRSRTRFSFSNSCWTQPRRSLFCAISSTSCSANRPKDALRTRCAWRELFSP
jgi:hypothetical protein